MSPDLCKEGYIYCEFWGWISFDPVRSKFILHIIRRLEIFRLWMKVRGEDSIPPLLVVQGFLVFREVLQWNYILEGGINTYRRGVIQYRTTGIGIWLLSSKDDQRLDPGLQTFGLCICRETTISENYLFFQYPIRTYMRPDTVVLSQGGCSSCRQGFSYWGKGYIREDNY